MNLLVTQDRISEETSMSLPNGSDGIKLLKELDLNPVRLFPGGPMALDVRVLETEIHRDL